MLLHVYIKIIFLPLLSSIICGLFGAFIGYEGTKLIGVTLLFITFIYSIIAFYQVGLLKNPYYLLLVT